MIFCVKYIVLIVKYITSFRWACSLVWQIWQEHIMVTLVPLVETNWGSILIDMVYSDIEILLQFLTNIAILIARTFPEELCLVSHNSKLNLKKNAAMFAKQWNLRINKSTKQVYKKWKTQRTDWYLVRNSYYRSFIQHTKFKSCYVTFSVR